MKLHMISIIVGGRKFTWFEYFPQGEKPWINWDTHPMLRNLPRGTTIGIG